MTDQSQIEVSGTGHHAVQVVKSAPDGLSCQIWKFSTHRLQQGDLMLDHYSKRERQTRRHKFNIVHASPEAWKYERIGYDRHSSFNFKSEDVPLPEPIKQAALDFVISNLKVVRQKDD